jgi:hypothetical protein
MARHASTYRQARRAEFAKYKANGGIMAWREFNSIPSGIDPWHLGSRGKYIGSPADRSKYVPHICAKQRAKGAK